MSLPKPVFITNDPDRIITELVADYESRVGKTLLPAQIERLILNAFAYRESLLRAQIQYAAEQNLVAFSNAPALDYLGQLVGVERLAASPAGTTVRFTLTPHSGVTIPQGFAVSTADGIVFETKAPTSVASITTVVDVEMICRTEGAIGNGYTTGLINIIVNPVPFIIAATNITISGGGADAESDDALRARIVLAPSSFSNAGSKGAYKYWALTASPSIIDVSVTNPVPGTVKLFPLMADGTTTPPAILDAVLAACNDEKIRPLTDTVLVESPAVIDVNLTITYRIYAGAVQADVEAAIEAAIEAFFLAKRQKLGQDIVDDQLIAAAMVPGVYDVSLGAFTTTVADVDEFVVLGGLTLTFGGSVTD